MRRGVDDRWESSDVEEDSMADETPVDEARAADIVGEIWDACKKMRSSRKWRRKTAMDSCCCSLVDESVQVLTECVSQKGRG